MPEKVIDSVKEMVIQRIMHADEPLRLEGATSQAGVRPVYDVVDLLLSESASRPDVTLTLMPHEGNPEIRNLELGSSDVDVKRVDQSVASLAAHAAARIMGPPPGPEKPQAASGGCNCACTAC